MVGVLMGIRIVGDMVGEEWAVVIVVFSGRGRAEEEAMVNYSAGLSSERLFCSK